MKSFEYLKPATIDEAVNYLDQYGPAAAVLAGGTDLITSMKEGVKSPDYVVDLKGIRGLSYIREGPDGLQIGAMTLLSDLESSPVIRSGYPGLARAAHLTASHQIRNLGTIGGNLCQEVQCWYYRKPQFTCYRKNGDQCFAFDGEDKFGAIFVMPGSEKCWAGFPSDLAPMLIALNARVRIAGPDGERLLPLENFYSELGNHLGKAEVLAEVELPAPRPGQKGAYVKFRLAKGVGFAIASAAAVIAVENGVYREARIALGSVGPLPWRARKAEESLTGRSVGEKTAEEAADAMMKESQPLKKNAYKEPVTRALIKRAILAATNSAS